MERCPLVTTADDQLIKYRQFRNTKFTSWQQSLTYWFRKHANIDQKLYIYMWWKCEGRGLICHESFLSSLAGNRVIERKLARHCHLNRHCLDNRKIGRLRPCQLTWALSSRAWGQWCWTTDRFKVTPAIIFLSGWKAWRMYSVRISAKDDWASKTGNNGKHAGNIHWKELVLKLFTLWPLGCKC